MSGALQEMEEATASVAAKVGPAVAGIGRGWGTGSAVVVGPGLVVTNAHNVGEGEQAVTFADGRTVTGAVAGVDVDGDLAVIAVDTGDVAAVEWAPDGGARLGAAVFALANPGGRGLRVTSGAVAAVGASFRGPRGRRLTGTIEHTAPMAKGSSGGPLVDPAGRLVALNTNRLGEGFYAAVPADAPLRARIEALGRGESPSRPRLGVGLVPGRAARHIRRAAGLPDRDGVLVRDVDGDGPGGRAGLRRGDLIVSAGGRPVTGVDDLHGALDGVGEGGSLELGLVRGADELTVMVAFVS